MILSACKDDLIVLKPTLLDSQSKAAYQSVCLIMLGPALRQPV